jgi:hypothetical protein
MTSPAVSDNRVSDLLHWSARISSIFLFALLVLFMTEGPPPFTRLSPSAQLEFASLGVVLVGYALGWRHPAAGGVACLLGITSVHLIELVANDKFAGWAFNVLAVPGLLYLATAYAASRGPLRSHSPKLLPKP